MRAMGVSRFGGPDAIEPLEATPPLPGPGEALVRLTRSGVNFIDVYMRSGVYKRSDTYKTPLPMILGMEGAGEIAARGPDAQSAGAPPLAIGDRVAFSLTRGTYADYVVAPTWKLAPITDGVSDEVAAALMLQGCTAHYLTHAAGELRPGDACLVHAAAGGVGQLLTQLAVAAGAEVFATVGSEDKAAIARARGARHVILYRDEDFRERIMAETGGRGVDVVFDSVGRETIARSIRSLRRRGKCVLFGASSGVVEAIEPLELAEAGSVWFTRPHLADYMASAEEIRARAGALFADVAAGRLEVAIDRVLPLEDAAEAHRLLETRATRGKLLLAIA